MSGALSVEHFAQALGQPLDRRVNRHNIVAHAERFGTRRRVVEAFVARKGEGQHDAMHARRAQRIHGHGRAERRVDASREPDHRAGKVVLVHIIAQAGDAGEVVRLLSVLDERDRPFLTDPMTVRAPPFGQPEHLLPGRELDGERGIRIEHEGRAVEHEFVLSANLVYVSQRQPRLGDPRLRDDVADRLLAHPIGRAVRHDEQLRARVGKRPAHLLAPDVLADRHAELHPVPFDRLRHGARREHALLVEHAVIRQIALVPHRLDAPAVEQRHGVINERRIAPGKPHQHGRSAVVGVAGKRLAGLARRLLEGRLQREVLDRIAGQVELREGDQVGALHGRMRARRAGFAHIALDVADDGVELRQRELEGIGCSMRHLLQLSRHSGERRNP